jgi:dTDP-glucose 4,6-dehydratase
MSKSILITGGCGFIASYLVKHVYDTTDWKIFVIDKLTYASNGFDRLRENGLLGDNRVSVFTWDLASVISEGMTHELSGINYIVHMAAETHVDNSIREPVSVIENNVMSTVHLLEFSRTLKNLELFFYFSTDEVYGPAPHGTSYSELNRHKPTNPYSASKSAAEQICVAYQNTYSTPLIIVNVMNAFGEMQHVEKFIPKCMRQILNDEIVCIHADATCTQSGSRFYIHARNIASAVMFLIEKGTIGELYNVTGEREVSNLEMAQIIAEELGKELVYELVNFHESRPGHDLRYALNGAKLFGLGWTLPVNFDDSLRETIRWTLNNEKWLK